MEYINLKTIAAVDHSVLSCDSSTVAELAFDGVLFTARFHYDFRPKPLCLSAEAVSGDAVELRVYPFRIELWINGQLRDEEWPCGHIALENVQCQGEMTVEISKEQAAPEKAALRTGFSAEEITLPGVNVGDCMPYADSDGKTYHLFYLCDRHNHQSKWGLGAHQWAHASTTDLITWNEHPMAIGISEPWEGSICTGSIIHAKGKYYAWYAVRMADGSPAQVTYAVSEDLDSFRKTGIYFTLPERYEATSARDPRIVEHDGVYHMFITTTLNATGRGCLAHLTSDSPAFASFTDCGPIMEWKTEQQPECPDWFRMGEYYYLVFSINARARYLVSHSPFGPWTEPEDNIVYCGRVPRCAFLGDRCIFCGFTSKTIYAGTLVMAEALQNPDGTLQFQRLN